MRGDKGCLSDFDGPIGNLLLLATYSPSGVRVG